MKYVIFLIFSTAAAARADLVEFYKARERGYNAWLMKAAVLERQRVVTAEQSKEHKLREQREYVEKRDNFKRRPWRTGQTDEAYLQHLAALEQKHNEKRAVFAEQQHHLNQLIEKIAMPMKTREYQLESDSKSGNNGP